MSLYSKESIAAFWSKVDIKEDKSACWVWMGAKNPKGYGNLTMNKKHTRAHRTAWELAHFPIPKGFFVCHACDNPSCCNPDHLMLGSHRANTIDMIIKNRQGFHKNKAIGTRNANAKFTDDKIIEIRRKYDTGNFSQDDLALEYGVAQVTIGHIVRRKTWKHIKEN